METFVTLHDDTVLRLNYDPIHRWKKFSGSYALIAALTTLYPAAIEALDATMYDVEMYGTSHIVKCVLAIQMVVEKYGHFPSHMFDQFYFMGIYGNTFSFYTDGKNVLAEESRALEYKQFDVSDEAIENLSWILEDLRISDLPPYEDLAPDATAMSAAFIEDETPELQSVHGSTFAVSVTAEKCWTDCLLCRALQANVGNTFPLFALQRRDACKVCLYDKPIVCSLFKPILDSASQNICVYGSSFRRTPYMVRRKKLPTEGRKRAWFHPIPRRYYPRFPRREIVQLNG